jgi:hypothetical protein
MVEKKREFCVNQDRLTTPRQVSNLANFGEKRMDFAHDFALSWGD